HPAGAAGGGAAAHRAVGPDVPGDVPRLRAVRARAPQPRLQHRHRQLPLPGDPHCRGRRLRRRGPAPDPGDPAAGEAARDPARPARDAARLSEAGEPVTGAVLGWHTGSPHDRRPMEPTLAPDEPVDLDNCAREPIHIPGSIQPRGLLLVVHDSVVVQATESAATLLARPLDTVLGHRLADVVGEDAADVIVAHAAEPGDVRDRNPVLVQLPDGLPWDAILHHPPGAEHLLVVELEEAEGARPLTYTGSYQQVRSSIAQLNRARSLQELYDVAATEVRRLTGFDRVMVYRFDADHNGEVVAEDRRQDLNAFLGLHYPATDIPAQARALYAKNWIRLLSDIGYTPSPLVPTLNPTTGAPLDLTHAVLRSVSPIHIEYLQNMGVTASMSISLLEEGKLWGLIACHHYSGPHAPPHGVRAAAEFLG